MRFLHYHLYFCLVFRDGSGSVSVHVPTDFYRVFIMSILLCTDNVHILYHTYGCNTIIWCEVESATGGRTEKGWRWGVLDGNDSEYELNLEAEALKRNNNTTIRRQSTNNKEKEKRKWHETTITNNNRKKNTMDRKSNAIRLHSSTIGGLGNKNQHS